MCTWSASGRNHIDPCMREKIAELKRGGVETLGCCCGHGRYSETIIVRTSEGIKELNSGKKIPRSKRFYKRDEDGVYYVPEVNSARAS